MTAQLEEVVVWLDAIEREDLGPDFPNQVDRCHAGVMRRSFSQMVVALPGARGVRMSRYWPGIGHGSSRSMYLHRRPGERSGAESHAHVHRALRRPSQHRNGHSSVEGELLARQMPNRPLSQRAGRGCRVRAVRPTTSKYLACCGGTCQARAARALHARSTGACARPPANSTAAIAPAASARSGPRSTCAVGAVHKSAPAGPAEEHTGR